MSNHSSPPASRRWLGLAVIAAAQFMVIMDTSIIGVALPQMQDDWAFPRRTCRGCSTLTSLRSGTVASRRQAVGPLRCAPGLHRRLGDADRRFGAARDGVRCRRRTRRGARQGAGAALIAPSALTMLMMLFGGNPRELTKRSRLRRRGAAGGPRRVLRGLITEYASWPWVFYINIPIALIILAVTPALMPPGGSSPAVGSTCSAPSASPRALAALVYGIVQAPEVGWGSARTWLVLAGAAALLVGFVALQASRREPLIRLGIFRAPNLGAANLAQLLLGAAWIPMWFFLTCTCSRSSATPRSPAARPCAHDGTDHDRHGQCSHLGQSADSGRRT